MAQSDLFSLTAKLDLQTAAFERGVANANKQMSRLNRTGVCRNNPADFFLSLFQGIYK